jgi:hypothetical protein
MMRIKTVAVHGSFDGVLPAKSVARAVLKSVAYEFATTKHATGLSGFVEHCRCSEKDNPAMAAPQHHVLTVGNGFGVL